MVVDVMGSTNLAILPHYTFWFDQSPRLVGRTILTKSEGSRCIAWAPAQEPPSGNHSGFIVRVTLALIGGMLDLII